MPGRQTVSALIVAAALAGCTGEGPTLGSLSSGVEATAALQQPGATLDLPAAYNPFSDRPASTVGRREVMENPSVAEIMKTGDLPEMALGRNDAPVTIVQYASMTCPQCRQFHQSRTTSIEIRTRIVRKCRSPFLASRPRRCRAWSASSSV